MASPLYQPIWHFSIDFQKLNIEANLSNEEASEAGIFSFPLHPAIGKIALVYIFTEIPLELRKNNFAQRFWSRAMLQLFLSSDFGQPPVTVDRNYEGVFHVC